MLTRISVATLTISALALSPAALAKTKDKATAPATTAVERVACEGIFGKDVTLEMIVAHYGKEHVEPRVEVDALEGESVFGTRVFGDDPSRAIVYQWFDDENSRFVAYVGLPPTLATPGGLHLGQTVAEVAALNGERFSMSGLWWDYGGFPFLHEGGRLWDVEANCVPIVRFGSTLEGDFDASAIGGDVTIYSDNPLLAKVGAKLEEVGMGYEFPEGYDGFDEGEPVEE
jgi:hypothetical protein